jgi:hypothetical protein
MRYAPAVPRLIDGVRPDGRHRFYNYCPFVGLPVSTNSLSRLS